jgi:hypothetical protein
VVRRVPRGTLGLSVRLGPTDPDVAKKVLIQLNQLVTGPPQGDGAKKAAKESDPAGDRGGAGRKSMVHGNLQRKARPAGS